jgi:HD-like signal output (HDOD) protein
LASGSQSLHLVENNGFWDNGMIAVPTDKINSGQVLAVVVRDLHDRLLLSKGHTIEAKHIRIFKIWGISEVNLVGADQHDDASESLMDPALIEQTQKSVETLFCHVDLKHPVIKEIYRIAVQFRCKHNIIVEDDNLAVDNQSIPPQQEQEKDFLKKLQEKNIILPEIPSVASELQEVIRNPMSSAEHIARVVSRSPSLTAVLLKIVNSSFYGFPSKISTVSHAVSLIGTQEISALALGISVLSIFKNIPKKTMDMHSFLRHSLFCGLLSRIFAAHKNVPQTEQLFVSGLLHDLGRLIFYTYFPDESRNVLARSRNRNNLLYKEEIDYLGCDHAQLGVQLMKQWKLPLILENNVLYHHKPSEAQQSVPATIVHLADIIVNSLGIGSSGEKCMPPLDYDAWENLELSPNSFETVIEQAIHQFQGLESVLHV